MPSLRASNVTALIRGDDLDGVPPAVLAMPFDPVRHDMLMNLKPLRPASIQSIVDELFLPMAQVRSVITAREEEAARPGPA